MARQNKDQKVDNFRLALIEDQTHKQLWAFRFTRMSFVITMISVVVAICLSLFCIIAYTPIRTFIPGYPDAHTKRAAIRNAIMIDSLENVINTWELYSENLSRVVDGKQPLRLDSLIRSNASANVSVPVGVDYTKVDGLALEARQKLNAVQPLTIGQASRISGVNPADISILILTLRKKGLL
jgi:hypothetical protein